MGTSSTEYVEDLPNPSVPEVLQREVLAPVVLVHPDGPVNTRELPTVNAAAFTEVLTDTTMRKILSGPDAKRKRVVLTVDGDIFVSFTGNSGSGMRLHGAAAVQGYLEITYTGNIFVAGVTGTTNVGVLVEYWAD